MDLSRFTKSDLLTVIGAAVLLISTFFPWYGSSSTGPFGGGSWKISLWGSNGFFAFLVFAASAGVIAIIVLRALEVFDLSELGFPEAIAVIAAAGLAGLITIFKFLSVEGVSASYTSEYLTVKSGRQFGAWVALVAMVVFAVGAVLKLMEERS